MTAREMSERWGGRIAVRTLNNWRTSGTGPPFVKIGGAVLYKLGDVLKWEASRTVDSTSQYTR